MPLKPSVEVRTVDGLLIAEFWDCLRLDPTPVQDLAKHYEKHLRAGGRPDLVIDMNGVTFAGSASLGGFLKIHRAAKNEGGRLIFCRVESMVRDVFRVSHIESLLTFADDLDDAIAQANGAAAKKPTARSADPASTDSAPPPVDSPLGGRGPLRSRRRTPGTDPQ